MTSEAAETPSQMVPEKLVGLIPFAHEPTRLLDHLPSAAIDVPVVEYMQHTATVGTATTVALAGVFLRQGVTL